MESSAHLCIFAKNGLAHGRTIHRPDPEQSINSDTRLLTYAPLPWRQRGVIHRPDLVCLGPSFALLFPDIEHVDGLVDLLLPVALV